MFGLALLSAVIASGDSPRVAPRSDATSAPTVVVSPNTGGAATPAATPLRSVTVSSIGSLKTALADDTVDEIIVADGTYHVSPSNESTPICSGSAASFANRTRPVSFGPRRPAA